MLVEDPVLEFPKVPDRNKSAIPVIALKSVTASKSLDGDNPTPKLI